MNTSKDAMNQVSELDLCDTQRGATHVLELAFNGDALGGAVVVSAISGPKVPPFAGD